MLQIIKKFLLKFSFTSLIIAKIYILYNNLIKNKKINIWKDKEYFIHSTKFGLIPYAHPLFDPEQYLSENFEIFFEQYTPKKNDIILELGAGIGNESLFISKLIGDEGKIYCVEPFLSIFNLLKKTVEINNLRNTKLINKALFNKKDKIGFSSEEENWLGGKIDLKSSNKIETFTLNSFILENKIQKLDFCKINIEGAEKYIVDESEVFFNICQNLAIECHDFLGIEEQKTHDLIKNFLIKKGFKIKKSERKKHPLDQFFIYASK